MTGSPNPSRRDALALGAATVGVLAAGSPAMAQTFKPAETDCLIVVDVQYDFLPGGALAVAKGDEIIPGINAVAAKFKHVVLTQDWHTKDHVSFASSHAGRKPFEVTPLGYGMQVLWPDHCVQGTRGAAISDAIKIDHAELVIRKGYRREIDSYSAFIEADGKTRTGLGGYLKERGFGRVFVCGLATDFCVSWTAQDARRSGFEAVVLEDLARAIDVGGSLEKAWKDMTGLGVTRAMSSAVT